jgi:hypothetical protein
MFVQKSIVTFSLHRSSEERAKMAVKEGKGGGGTSAKFAHIPSELGLTFGTLRGPALFTYLKARYLSPQSTVLEPYHEHTVH